MNKKHIKLLIALIDELAEEVKNCKEFECKNSGLNWLSDFKNTLHCAEVELLSSEIRDNCSDGNVCDLFNKPVAEKK